MKMTLLAGLLAFAAFPALAQDAKTIVQKHNDAVGGLGLWEKTTSLTREGTMNVMGMEMPMKLTILKDKGMRQDFSMMGTANYVVMTPEAGWMYIPSQGHTKPEPMPAEQLKAAADEMGFEDALMKASRKNHTVELLGKEDLDGVSCYKLKVTDPDKQEMTCYVDAGTWNLVRLTKMVHMQGQDMEVVTRYSDFRKLPSGIVVPMKEDSGDAGSMTFTKAEENTVKDDSIFKP